MAIKTAQASLTGAFALDAITGFIPRSQGFVDSETGYVRANTTGQWSAVSSWGSFISYNQSYTQIRWTSDLIDVGEIKDFTMKIQTEYEGQLFFIIHVSDIEAFAGEETEYTIQNGDLAVPSFRGRYAYVTAVVDGNELRRMTITTESKKTTRVFADVDTSTLSGTASARLYSLPVPVSKVVDVQIQVKEPTPYAVDLYVSNTPTSEVLIPMTISKTTSGVTFALYGIDNVARNGVVDIQMTTMARQAMISGNLVVVE
jgi:hypothetical protein